MCSQVVVNERAIADGPVLDASIDVSSPQIPACTQHIDMVVLPDRRPRRVRRLQYAYGVYPKGY